MASYPISAKGYTSVILLLNMRRFVPQEGRSRFENLRGTEALHRAIQEWSRQVAGSPFLPTPPEEEDPDRERGLTSVEEIGFATGVFRSVIRERFISPTYLVEKGQFTFPPLLADNLQFKKLFFLVWQRWKIYLRASMSGFFTLRLTWHYEQPRSLVEIVREVHRLQAAFDVPSALNWLERARREYRDDLERLKRTEESISALLEWLGIPDHQKPPKTPIFYPVHWRLAMEVINRFLESAPLTIPSPKGEIHLQPMPITPSIPLHDVYILHHLDQLYVAPEAVGKKGAPGTRIQASAQAIRDSKQVRNGIFNLVEGSLLRPLNREGEGGEEGTGYEFPTPRWKLADTLLEQNLSSWSDEFCLLAPRVGIIIPSQKYRDGYELGVSSLPQPTLRVPYARYWEAIERMVEFVFEARVLAQLIESDTSRLLEEMTEALEQTREEMYQGDVKLDQKLKDQSIRAAHLTRLAALVQNLAHPFFWSRAEYAMSKVQTLMEALDVPRLLEHIQHNIDGITSLASHVDEIYIADLAEKNNRRAAVLSLLLGSASLALVFLMIPSFLQDWQQFCGSCNPFLFWPYLAISLLFGLFLVAIFVMLLGKALRYPHYRNPLKAIDHLLK